MIRLPVAVAGLPAEVDHLLPKRLYAVTASHARLIPPCAAGTLAAALAEGRPTAIVTALPFTAWRDALLAYGVDAAREISRGNLRLLEAAADWAAQMARHGPEQFVDELDHFDIPRGTFVVIAPADTLLAWNDARRALAQARVYRAWCARRSAIGVLLFGPNMPPAAGAVSFRVLSDSFAGVAHLRGDGAQFHWEVEHWRTQAGTVVDRTFPLAFDARGAPRVLEAAAAEGQARLAPDEDLVWTTGAALDDAAPPEGWTVLGSEAALLERVYEAVAATCLLAHTPQRELQALSRTVYDLRRRMGNALKIVVRVRGPRLRYNDELLLLRLGANAVVPGDADFAQLKERIAALRGRLYARDLAPDFEQAILAAVPPPAGGYLSPARFSVVTREALLKAESIGLENALVRLHLMSNVPHLDALRACKLRRPGDLFTADDNSVLLFLFACRAGDIDATVDRVFSTPLAELFEGQTRYAAAETIRNALDELAVRLQGAPMADFSAELAAGAAGAATAAKAAPAAVAVAPKPYVPAGRKRTVIRAPLPLKRA